MYVVMSEELYCTNQIYGMESPIETTWTQIVWGLHVIMIKWGLLTLTQLLHTLGWAVLENMNICFTTSQQSSTSYSRVNTASLELNIFLYYLLLTHFTNAWSPLLRFELWVDRMVHTKSNQNGHSSYTGFRYGVCPLLLSHNAKPRSFCWNSWWYYLFSFSNLESLFPRNGMSCGNL